MGMLVLPGSVTSWSMLVKRHGSLTSALRSAGDKMRFFEQVLLRVYRFLGIDHPPPQADIHKDLSRVP